MEFFTYGQGLEAGPAQREALLAHGNLVSHGKDADQGWVVWLALPKPQIPTSPILQATGCPFHSPRLEANALPLTQSLLWLQGFPS